eukprot:gene2476-18137_t
MKIGVMPALKRHLILSILTTISIWKYSTSYRITRPSSSTSQGDEYDKGIFVYQHLDRLVEIDCPATAPPCQCNIGGTFIFNVSSSGIVNKEICIGDYGLQKLGCEFRFDTGDNYVKVASRKTTIGTVKLGYNEVVEISMLKAYYWNMTWNPIAPIPFEVKSDVIKWNGDTAQLLQKYTGMLLKLEMEKTHGTRIKSCLLLKIPGSRDYPLSPYIPRKTSDIVLRPTSQLMTTTTMVQKPSTEIAIKVATSSASLGLTTAIKRSFIRASPSSISRVSQGDKQISTHCSLDSLGLSCGNFRGTVSKYAKLTPVDSVTLSASTGSLHFAPSSVIKPTPPGVETKDESKASLGIIVGASIGGIALIILIVVAVIFLRKQQLYVFFDSLKVSLQNREADKAKSKEGVTQGRFDLAENPVYDKNLRLGSVSANKGLSLELYDYAYEGTANGKELASKNCKGNDTARSADPVYSELDGDERPVYHEVGGVYQAIDENTVDKADCYQGLNLSNINKSNLARGNPNAPSPVYQELEQQNDNRTEPVSPVYQTVESDLGGKLSSLEKGDGRTNTDPIYRELEGNQ